MDRRTADTRRPAGTGRGAPRGRAGDRDAAQLRGPRRWGGLARRGAGREAGTGASDAWRAAAGEARRDRAGEQAADGAEPQRPWRPDEWIDEGEIRDEAEGAVGRSRSSAAPRGRRGRASAAAAGSDREGVGAAGRRGGKDDLRGVVTPKRLPRFEALLKDASTAFRRERYDEARRILRPLAEEAPGASSVRELYGLTLYRLGRWAQAKRELEAFRNQTGSTEQHPVLADCYRGLGQYARVEELWDELRQASPSAELVAEGRIVAAGALADQDRLDEAIALLEASAKPARRAKLHHLRMAYALADLYERAGELPRARELFALVAANDTDFADVQARLRALR